MYKERGDTVTARAAMFELRAYLAATRTMRLAEIMLTETKSVGEIAPMVREIGAG
jgi:hypothetical protein